MEPTVHQSEPEPAHNPAATPAPAADTDGADSEPLYSGPADGGADTGSEPAFLAYIRPSFWD